MVQLSIVSSGIDSADQVRRSVERRLLLAFSRHRDRLSAISVHLRDANGPKGGVDKRFLIRIKPAALPEFVIEGLAAELAVAIDRAIARAKQTLVRRLQRSRQVTRQDFAVEEAYPRRSDLAT